MDNFDILNNIYVPLCNKSTELSRGLKSYGYQAKTQFCNNHSVKRNGVFATEYFPIPVIFIEGFGDVGVDIDSVWFEAVLPKSEAIKLDYEYITSTYKVEIYGSECFLNDLYNDSMEVLNIKNNILRSPEINICILFYLSKDITCSELIKILQYVVV